MERIAPLKRLGRRRFALHPDEHEDGHKTHAITSNGRARIAKIAVFAGMLIRTTKSRSASYAAHTLGVASRGA
jgi:hypothetical protein